MSKEDYSWEEIKESLESIDYSGFKGIDSGGGYMVADSITKDDLIEKICRLYRKVKPFLKFIEKLPIPAFVKRALRTLTNLLDMLCPG